MPDPTLLTILAVAGWAAAIAALVLWRRAAPYAPECHLLRGRLSDAEARVGAGEARADRDGAELRRLTGVESRLTQAVEALEARLSEASTDRARLAREAAEERATIQANLDEARGEVMRLRVANERLATDLAAREVRHDEDVRLLTELRADMTDRFKTLADATLKEHGERFGSLNRERMDALLKPMREQVDHFQRELREAHTGAAKDRERLKAEIDALSRRSEAVSREAVALTNALKGEKQRQGAWGEMILERVLQDSGLRKGHEYRTQVSVRDDEGGRRRPDAVVRLPGDKVVVIDAKVSLTAYERAVNAEDGDERRSQLRAHSAAVRKHIDDLRARDYSSMVEGSVDYVLMFMPVEGALAAALEVADDLTSYAIAHRVGIATPTTLMLALRTIHHVWAVERRESNAAEIAERAGLMYDKMAGVIESVESVGRHLDGARGAHADALDRLTRGNGNLVGQFDKMRRLGARTKKEVAVPFDADDDDAAAFLPGTAAE